MTGQTVRKLDMQSQPLIKLNDGRSIPQLGFGVAQIKNADAAEIVGKAIEIGYRSIDTAAFYNNEEGVGEAVRRSGLPRESLFVTTKLWNDRHGYHLALKTFDESMQRLKLDYVDLYLIHWPLTRGDKYIETWRAFIKLKEEGCIRSIGVSNFKVEHLRRLIGETGVTPVLNQIELHPEFQQKQLRAFHAEHDIATESWSPLGKGKTLQNPVLAEIAQKRKKTPAQIAIRWQLDNGLIVIPKSNTPSRIAENFDVFGFTLSEDEIGMIETLDRLNGRVGPNPDTFELP